MINAINHVAIPARDVTRSQQFYSRVLELTQHPADPNWFAVEGDYLIRLVESERMTNSNSSTEYFVALEVDDLGPVVDRIIKNGHRPFQISTDRLHHKVIQRSGSEVDYNMGPVYVTDPDSNVIMLSAG